MKSLAFKLANEKDLEKFWRGSLAFKMANEKHLEKFGVVIGL